MYTGMYQNMNLMWSNSHLRIIVADLGIRPCIYRLQNRNKKVNNVLKFFAEF